MSDRPRPILTGVAALADRPVDGARVGRVMAAVAVVLALGAAGGVEWLLRTANVEADGGRMLRAVLSAPRPVEGAPARLAVVLVDGLRVDRARALPSLASEGQRAQIDLELPTLSRPFQHALFTGVPTSASGVRTNRFADAARHDSLLDQVREAGGSVTLVAEGLDWIRRMHGAPGDGGTDADDALGAPLDQAILAWREAPPPALLVVHVVRTDHTAHADGVDSPSHERAVATADDVIRRVAAAGEPIAVLSDHGHLMRGGHGGPEPEVARAPLWTRGLPGPDVTGVLSTTRLAPTFARALGVAPPRHSVAPAVGARVSVVHERARGLVRGGEAASRARLGARRRWTALFAIAWLVLTLGPIKRAYGFDRSVPVAILLWPALVIGLHLLLGRPLSLSAIDGRAIHAARVLALGGVCALLVMGLGAALGQGDRSRRLRRAAACVAWSAAGSALAAGAWVGFALGPWTLGARAFYLPLLLAGASACALSVCAVGLAVPFASASDSPNVK